MFVRTLAYAWMLLLGACQPAPMHQGGVVFVAPPGGFAVVGRVQVAGAAPAQPARVRLVGRDGHLAEALAGSDGSFRLDHVPTGGGHVIAALHVEAAGLGGYVAHDSGGGSRPWLPHKVGETYDLGVVQLAAGRATSDRNLLARHDADGDGLTDDRDLDDDADGVADALDPDDADLGVLDAHAPI